MSGDGTPVDVREVEITGNYDVIGVFLNGCGVNV